LKNASTIIGVDSDPVRLKMAKQMGADEVIDHSKTDAVKEILRMTGGRGMDVAIEALGLQQTFESALRADSYDALPGRQRTAYDVFGHRKDGVLKVAICASEQFRYPTRKR
jgi:hypothetical protein